MRCKVYTTSATKDLARLMLEDSAKIQEEDIRYVNKINKRLGLPLRKPLYTRKDALKAAKRFRSLDYGKKFCAANNIFVTLYNSGHILGSSIIVLDVKDQENFIRIGYAVDLGRPNLPMLDTPMVPGKLDYLIIESTYGGRFHRPIEEAKTKLKDSINRTVSRGGKIIIPSFTLERTQEVVYFLNELLKEKAIPSIPIYVDSPLATDITEIFKLNPDYLNAKTQKAIREGNSPFEFLNLTYIQNQEKSKSLNNDKRPMIIIAGSGMCESGRVLHHLKNNIEESRNTVLVVGYMAKDTLGKKIVERQHLVRIFGVEYELNAEVVVINAFSGHADQNGLYGFISASLPLKRIFLVHADPDQAQALFYRLNQDGLNVYIPDREEEVILS
jgi:metallo-beta-lactamase family protein